MNPFILFVYLQLMDLLSTIAALIHGQQELNPVVRWMMSIGSDPFLNLAVVKLIGVIVGYIMWRNGGKVWIFDGLNWIFAVVVALNVVGLI